MERFALLQSSTSCNPPKRNPGLSQNLNVINGTRVVNDTFREPGDYEDDLFVYDLALTYGEDNINDPSRREKLEAARFVPNYVIFAQKCLRFYAYFVQNIDTFINKKSNKRQVIVTYFLEDDTILITEPPTHNAGLKQGTIVHRAKIPKDEFESYNWKDFNVGQTIKIYGINYKITDCDSFTRKFLTSQGIGVGPTECSTDFIDDTTELKNINYKSGLLSDPQFRFQHQDEILTFIATWNEDQYSILYHLIDDTILVRRIPKSKKDDDPMLKLLLRRTKIMKENKTEPNSYLEKLGANQPSTDELKFIDSQEVEYYGPEDFIVGETVLLLGRSFKIIDCTYSTRKFYSEKYGIKQPEAISFDVKKETFVVKKSSSRKWITDDSFIKRPYGGATVRDAFIKRQFSWGDTISKLRYKLQMVADFPEEENRHFIMDYSLSQGTIEIKEIKTPNGGRPGGSFLASTLVAKPDSNENDPVYYSEHDFYIGSELNIFNHRFIIIQADLSVWNYIKAHPNDYSELRNNLEASFSKSNLPIEEKTV